MNKRNFVYNYVMRKRDFDNLQSDVEDGINNLANTLTGKGIVKGLEVTISNSNATVSPGVAFDGDGKRIELPSSATVDMSSVSRPGTGQFKWVTLVLKHKVANEGTVTDGHNKVWPLRLLDSYQMELLVGAAGTENGATKPTVSASQVPLIDIKVDESTAWNNLTTESNRRPGPLVNLLNVVYPIGYTYAQYPGGLTPAAMLWPGTWEAQFEDEGVFFRTPGGQASTFGSGIQEDAMQRITGYLGDFNDYAARRGTATGAFTGTNANSGTGIGRGSGDAYTTLNFDSANSVFPASAKTDDNETRPRNRTFRIWKRTA